MRKNLNRLAICLGAVVLVAIIGVNAIAYRHAYAMMHFTHGVSRTLEPEKLSLAQKLTVLACGVTIPRPESKIPANVLGPITRSFRIDCAEGIKLGAWYCPATNRDTLVILFHGYSGEKSGTV